MPRTEKVSATNLKNLAYTILKNFNDDTVKNKKFTELPNCVECDKKIFASPNKAFTVLLCGHTYHRICIEKKLLLTKQQTCPFPDCGKSVEILEEFTEPDSQSSTSSIVGKMGKQLTIQSQEIIDEEMTDADNGSKDKSVGIAEGPQKRPIEVNSEEANTTQDKSPSKKPKKEVKNEDSQMLKRLIKELTTNSPQVSEISEEAMSRSSEDLLYLYNNITNSELRKEIASREVIRSYFLFGKVVSQRFEYYYKKSHNLYQAQIDINDELKEKLPDASENAHNKRKERAQKIYFLFSSIGIEKIELVKSFSADSISKLSVEKIKYIKDKIMKTAPQIM
ncbi:4607_t:CDS:1 [Diversispora eburnea]|uniref:4607_t:CDS:1 n=1 Tax=Diversispora eburnea TaxID=1213867 RepID=A0A9N9CYC1_9GLOM|nr:4607_t:CDS:1 [Diversispora eburnea]